MDRYAEPGRLRSARSGPAARLASRPPVAPLLLAFALTLANLAATSAAQAVECVRESQSVRVAGQINRQRMTRLVDDRATSRTQRDTVVSMVLRDPLCVMLPDDISLALRPRRIMEVQLLHTDRLPAGRDQGILIDGKVLLASSNAHHHPVLVDIVSIPSTRNAATPPAPPTTGRTTLATARLTR
jgi:hypothetical protein